MNTDQNYKVGADALYKYLDDMLYNPAKASLDTEALPEEFVKLGKGLQYFNNIVSETRKLAKELSTGNLNCDLPTRENEMAAPLKSLHASLKHLTWQTQQVAKGDYRQRVDFMGDFSEAFNNMTLRLEQQRKIDFKEKSMFKTRMDAMLATCLDPILLFDLNGQLVGASDSYLKRCEIPSLNDILGKKIRKLFEPVASEEFLNNTENLLRTVIKEKRSIQIEQDILNPVHQTSYRHYQIQITPMHDADGNIEGIIMFLHDITDVVDMKNELDAVVSNYKGLIWRINKDRVITTFNGQYLHEKGRSLPQAVGKNIHTARYNDGHIDIIGNVEKTFAEGSQEWESEILGKAFQSHTTPVYDNSGHIIGVVGSTYDVTERKAMEGSLRKRETMSNTLNEMSVIFLAQNEESFEDKMTTGVRLLVDAMNLDRLSVWRNAVTLDGFVTSQIYRWDRESCGTTPPLTQFQNVLFEELAPNWKEYLTGNVVVSGPVRLINNAPPTLTDNGALSVVLMPLIINNAFWGFVLFEDLHSERYFDNDSIQAMRTAAFLCANTVIRSESDREKNEAIESAIAASRAKGEFLSRMSHEIRTPLNAVMGMISIGIGTNDMGKKNYCLERADGTSRHLLRVINDILDMSKIEADKFELSYDDFDFEQTLINVANVVSVKAEEKKQEFVVNLNKNVPHYIRGDQLRLTQVITNLLSNAIKFTPEHGTVALNIEKTDERNDDVVLKFEVVDNGIGISEEQQKRLFTSFGQADIDISQKFGGTGLGLTISKRIVELMDGAIWIESDLGKGSKFIFTIMVRKSDKKQSKKLLAGIKKEDVRILAVDDSPETRDYFLHVMDSLHMSCDVAASGYQAIEMIRNAGNRPYNIFFVDWLMPEMNGIELTRKIKEINGENSVVIMISVADWNTIEKEAREAGVKQFISKPLFPSTLIDAINNCIGVETKEETPYLRSAGTGEIFDFSGHTLLIAEDIEINKEIMSSILEKTGVSINFAANGKVAVSMFEENPDKYDLILMDIQMPEMDGYEATRTIRALNIARAKEVPIIAMTANVFKEDIERCKQVGMNDHTGKPIDSDALFEILCKYLVSAE